MKRKFANRPNWRRVLKRRMVIRNVEYMDFQGYAALIIIDKITEPLWANVCGENICVADKGYSWLTVFPPGESHVVTAMLNQEQKVVQWYIDICKRHGLTEDNIPWYDDLYLDIIVSSQNEVTLIDQEDLEQALQKGIIDQNTYDYAYVEANKLLNLLTNGQFKLLEYTKSIFEMLFMELDSMGTMEGAKL